MRVAGHPNDETQSMDRGEEEVLVLIEAPPP
jgi:hypothetical protein